MFPPSFTVLYCKPRTHTVKNSRTSPRMLLFHSVLYYVLKNSGYGGPGSGPGEVVGVRGTSSGRGRLAASLCVEGVVFAWPQCPHLVVVLALVVSLGPRELTLSPAWPQAWIGPVSQEWQALRPQSRQKPMVRSANSVEE